MHYVLERAEREIASTDAEIDELVYDLNGITEEERRIVEAARQQRPTPLYLLQ